jgi:hypothetical protein
VCERVVVVCAQWQKDRTWKPEAKKKPKKPAASLVEAVAQEIDEQIINELVEKVEETKAYETEDGALVVGEKPGSITAYVPAPPPEQIVVEPLPPETEP